ncbi:DUF6233 domain-containing protein [Streptomyces sp. CB01201]|uniref:DUF6233 domain-containing protein n=1 Tax=Streptomyces sp. CB01201 TaxID=2020324 RepID=UPI001F459628|nr:DUF6233 domain-containing protein [Streptomyces sp. CB01201]
MPSHLDLLRFLERVQLQQLDQTRRWIAAEEARQAEIAARQPPPPPPDWVITAGRGPALPGTAGARTVHVGGCGMAHGTSRPVTRDQALRAITVEDVPPCQYCRPDSELGVLD